MKIQKNESVKARIIKATEELLHDKDIEAITCRDISDKAGVGLGNINYHFKSKDKLITGVVKEIFQNTILGFKNRNPEITNPRKELAQIIFQMFAFILKYKKIGRYVLKQKLTNRTFNAERYLLKYFEKDDAGKGVPPLQLRLKALQINSAILIAFFNHEEFYKYCEIDLYNQADLKRMIACLLDSVHP